MTMQAFYGGPPGRRLFGVFHPPAAAPRAALLMCPPLLHEHVRSYRFFSLVAERLAQARIACLRFDYVGTGDADGDDAEFSPASALQDIERAAGELSQRAPGVPLVLMGVRASAMFAARAAGRVGAAALWAWQPIYDGRDYARALDLHYRAELSSRDRFPARTAPALPRDGDLMGYRVGSAFGEALATLRFEPARLQMPVAIVDDGERRKPNTGAAHYALPASLTAWTEQIDMRGLLQLRDAEPVLQQLIDSLPDDARRVAHG